MLATRVMFRAMGLAVTASACRAPEVTTLTAGSPADVLLYAVASAEGELIHAGLVTDGAIETAAAADAVVLVWSLEPDQFVHATGGPVSRDDLRSLRAQSSSELAGGSCGRCLSPSEGDRLVLHPGSTCTVPPGFVPSTALVEGEVLDPALHEDPRFASIQAQVQLTAPGDCPCSPSLPTQAPTAQLLVCPLLPEGGAWPMLRQSITVAPGGWFGTFARHRALVIDPEGRRYIDRSYPPFDESASAAIPKPRPPGEPPEFLMLDRVLGSGARSPLLFRLDGGALSSRDWGLTNPGLRVANARWQPERQRLLFFGRTNEGRDEVASMSETIWPSEEATLGFVRRVRGCDAELFQVALEDGLVVGSGSGIAIAGNGFFAFRATEAADWQCNLDFAKELTLASDDRSFNPRRHVRVEALGSTIYVCGLVETEAVRQAVFFSFDSSTLTEGAIPFGSLRDLSALVPSGCEWVAPTPSRERLIALGSGGEALVIDTSTVVRFESVGAALGDSGDQLTPAPNWYASTPEGHEFLANVNFSTIWRRAPGASQFLRTEGPSDPNHSTYVVSQGLRGDSNSVAAIFRSGGLSPLVVYDDASGGCERYRVEVRPFAGDSPLSPSDRPLAALRTEASHHLIVTKTDEDERHVTAVDLNTNSVLGRITLPSGLGGFHHIAAWRADSALLFFGSGRVLEIRGWVDAGPPTVSEVPVIWDDPRSPEVEAQPVDPSWANLQIINGVGWAHGRDVFARVLPNGEGPPRIEGFWLRRAAAGPFVDPEIIRRVDGHPPKLSAAFFSCPDTALLLSEEVEANASRDLETNRIFSWTLGPSGRCTGRPPGSLELCDTPFFDQFRFTDDASGGLMEIFRARAGLRPVLGDGRVMAEGGAYPLPERIRSGWYDPETSLLWYSRVPADDAPDRVGLVRE